MFKKLMILFMSGVFSLSLAQAQDFEFVFPNPAYDTTSGTAVFQSGDLYHDNVEVKNYIRNISADSFAVSWRLLTVDTTVKEGNEHDITDHWILTGICDNIVCRGEFEPWYFGVPDTSFAIAPDSTALMEVRVYAPTSSRDTTMIFKIEITSPNQVDTAVYVLTKEGTTGISAVPLADNQVSVYPNPLPAGQALHVYVDKQLNTANAVVYNIIGQRQMVWPMEQGKEVQSFNVSSLPAGMYILKLTSEHGQTITSRKFSKQ